MAHLFVLENSKRHILKCGQGAKPWTTHLPVLCSVSAYPIGLYPLGDTFINFCALSTAKGMELKMKKRLLACILVIAMVLSVGATAVFAEDSTHVSPSFAGDINIDKKDILDSQNSFEFSMTPKSKEWKNYSSVQLKEMLNIPLSTAEKMDTATLLKTVLDYPFMIDIFAYDNTTQGFEGLSLEFNGAAVLLQRPDLAEKLQTIYKNKMMALKTKNNISDTDIMQKMFMESLLVYPKVYDMLSQDEKEAVAALSQQVSDKFQTSSLVMEKHR